jgi:hypothetical protein
MQTHLVAALTILLGLPSLAGAQDADYKDYLRRGEGPRSSIQYDRAVRHVLARAWRSDVVLRMVDIPAFDREYAVGLSRSRSGYTAFATVVAPPHSIWYTLGFGSDKPIRKPADYRRVRAIVMEKAIPDRTAARIAGVWRQVLTNRRNYRNDRLISLHSNQFTYYLAFSPNERITAYMPGWGPNTLQLIELGRAVGYYVEGLDSERDLISAIEKAERKLGI